MSKLLSITIALFLIIPLTNAFSFDLKKLQDNLNQLKDQNNPNNPLGNLMKNMQGMTKDLSNKSNSGSVIDPSTPKNKIGGKVSSGNIKLAKSVCEPDLPKLVKNLPGANISNLEKDFSKSVDEIEKIINSIPSSINDPIIPSLTTFNGAFETKEVEQLFNKFISKKDLDSLSQLRELSLIDPGFSKDKKQIKADANFAYGLVHYFYSNSGGNKNLGIQYIKNGASSPDNIGSLVVFGAWQFYGKNIPQNILNGNKMAMDGYNRAFDKNLRVNTPQHKFYRMNKFTFGEKIFLEIAGDNKNPYKSQYQSQLAQAAQMQKEIDAELARSTKYDRKSGWFPLIIRQQNRQHDLLSRIGEEFLGFADEFASLKAKYLTLKGKVSNDNKLIERMVMINKEMAEKISKALERKNKADERGQKIISNLNHDNEIMIMQNHKLGLSMVSSVFSGNGLGGAGFSEIAKIGEVVGMYQNVACQIYGDIKKYAKRTNLPPLEPVEDPEAEFKEFG